MNSIFHGSRTAHCLCRGGVPRSYEAIRVHRWAGTATTTVTAKNNVPNVGAIVRRKKKPDENGPKLLVTVGVPFVLFSLLAAWVVGNALDGKLRERDTAEGRESKSIRQAAMEEEHDEMVERLNKIVKTDYDNEKRIKRPEEVLEERRLERQRRNALHRRAYHWLFPKKEE